MVEALPSKFVPETITVEFDFSGDIEWAEVITSVAVSVEAHSGTDPSPNLMLSGNPIISGPRIKQDVTGGYAGVIYGLVATATGDTGTAYIQVRKLAVLSETSSFVPSNLPQLSGNLPDGTPNLAYSERLFISGGYPPYEYNDASLGTPPWMGFSVDGSELVCAGIPDETVDAFYSFTVSIKDAVNAVAASPQELQVLVLSISGDIEDGLVTEVIAGAYTQADGVMPVTFTIDSGTFPPGITLDADGTYAGTFTEAGAFSWVVKGTDAVGNVALLNDACVIRYYSWLIARHNEQLMYVTTDPLNGPWVTTTRDNPAPTSTHYIPTQTGLGQYVIWGGTTYARVFYSNDVTPGPVIASTPVALGYFAKSCIESDGIVVIPYSNSNGYSLSIDNGQTFTYEGRPLGVASIGHMGRLDSGRWILSYGQGSSTAGIMYCDDLIPYDHATWIDVPISGSVDGTGSPVATTGNIAAIIFENGRIYRSVGGAVWDFIEDIGTGSYVSRRCAIGFDSTLIISVDQAGNYIRSTNSGLSWELKNNASTPTPQFYHYANSLMMCSGTTISYSTDGGASFSALSLPFTPNFQEFIGIGPVLSEAI